MKNTLLFSAYLLFGISMASSQTMFVIDDFSDQYYGQLFIADTSSVFSPGWVAILDKKSDNNWLK